MCARLLGSGALAATSGLALAGSFAAPSWSFRVLLGCAALVALAVAVRYWQLRIVVTAHEVRFVNWLHTTKTPWDDVVRFEHDLGLSLRCHDGRLIGSAAFPFVPGALESSRRPAQRATKELEAIRKRRQRGGLG